MGGCVSSDERKRSKQIDRESYADRKKLRSEVKLLLLGSGESGKSTVFKQMKIIQANGQGYTTEELLSYRYIVYGNCVTQMKVILNAVAKLGLEYQDEEMTKRAERLNQVPSGGDAWSAELGEDIKHLWTDPAVRAAYEKRDAMYQLNDSSAYFFDNIERFIPADYVPTQMDVLRVRVRSTGIEEATFTFEGTPFCMLDVGGQRSERRKWIHCFDKVTAVIFCVATSEYDQKLREEETMNRMQESLLLFEEILNSQWFKRTPVILFLNKIDLFEEKIQRVSLQVCFPNYEGGDDFESAKKFVCSRFLERNENPDRDVYPHYTCAISTENMVVIWKAVSETLLKRVLSEVLLT